MRFITILKALLSRPMIKKFVFCLIMGLVFGTAFMITADALWLLGGFVYRAISIMHVLFGVGFYVIPFSPDIYKSQEDRNIEACEELSKQEITPEDAEQIMKEAKDWLDKNK